LKEKKYLPQDKAALKTLRTDAEKILKQSINKTSANHSADMQILLDELKLRSLNLERQNKQLCADIIKLQQQQTQLTNIYDLAPIGYFILDKAGYIIDVNNNGANLLEGGKAEFIFARLKNFIPADCAGTYQLFFKQMLSTRARQTCQLKMITKGSSKFYAQLEGITIYTAADAGLNCYIAIVDISDRIQTQQYLAETKDRLELALEAAAAGTWELDLNTMAFYLHGFNYHLCAVKNNQFDGRYKTFISLIHPDDQAMVDCIFNTAIAQEKGIDLVCRFINADNKVCYASLRGHIVAENGQNKRLVGILMDITEKKRIEEEAALIKKDQQKIITTATLFAEENERKRISEALHDSVGQLLYGIKMQLDQLYSAKQPSADTQHLYELLNSAVKETRDIAFELAPSILTDFGLPTTITELAHRFSTPQLQIRTQITGFTNRLDLFVETCIFRIIQELINNCMKHSGARIIDLRITQTDLIEIIIHDDGKGFNVKQQEARPTGSGFSSIKNRIGLYNGTLNLKSEPGKGTTITLNLPIK
jgi:signal transduction histidine kinase